MSSLKVRHAWLQPLCTDPRAQKRYEKSVTRDTSHSPIGPYAAAAVVGSVHHASRATNSAARSAKVLRADGIKCTAISWQASISQSQARVQTVQCCLYVGTNCGVFGQEISLTGFWDSCLGARLQSGQGFGLR